ncbi:Lysophospholipase L1 [Frateuria terrea]|uniref:Lysophospholipase L1 n=1 Tax=Frateuria terrea TaxID=529704 RepID=A0A1H6S6M4_9GAMM|nr:Lysophospholipase L1 [Frateuria terrea]SFP22888.1 Lysophospholipase L1 [Frateuria terrea]
MRTTLRYYRWAAVLALACAAAPPAGARGAEHWVGAWAAAPLRNPMPANAVLRQPPLDTPLHHQTVREIVRIGAGGRRLRVHLDNRFGERPVTIGAVAVARAAAGDGFAVDTGTLAPVTFGGEARAVLPAGGVLDSDPLGLAVHAGERLAVSLFVPGAAMPASWHPDARYRQAISLDGDHTRAARMPLAGYAPGYDWLARIDVAATPATRAIVALGDSITNGFRASAGMSYPEQLADRLRRSGCALPVLDAGIDGNQVAAARGGFSQGQSMWQRLQPDVLSVPGAHDLLLLGGINDIGEPTMAARAAGRPVPQAQVLAGPVIATLGRIAAAAREHGLRLYGATLPPFGGTLGAYSAQGEAARQTVNAWIRTRAPYDAVIDFDAALRDPAQPQRLRPRYDSGDHIHPNDAGYGAMAAAVPLALFACPAPRQVQGVDPSRSHPAGDTP